MSVKESLGLPDVVRFVYGLDGEVHIQDMFGGTWCDDFYDEETDTYGGTIEPDGPADEPEHESGLHSICLAAAKAETT